MNKINKSNFNSIDHIRNTYLKNETKNINKNSTKKNTQPSFSNVLNSATKSLDQRELKFSKHASMRLDSRNITISENQMKRLEEGTKIAKSKGVKDSLVIVDDIAFIVNIKNHTVVTAVNEAEDKTFTNIDGAVII